MSARKRKFPARVREPQVGPAPLRVGAGEFKARCLALMDEVSQRQVEYIITKRGLPVARLVPVEPERSQGAPRRKKGFGSLKGSIEIHGDIVAPIESPETYDEPNL